MKAHCKTLWRRVCSQIQSTHFYEVFNFQDDLAKGRAWLLLANLLANIIANMVGGVFLTGFFLSAGLSTVKMSTMNCIPYIMSLTALLSPFALGKMKSRKKALCLSRLAFYGFSVFAMTFVPVIFHNQQVVLIMIALCLILSSGINSLFASGFSAWHINFLPESIRASYFTYQQILNGLVSAVALIVSGIVSDKVHQAGNASGFFVGLRVVAFFICLLEVYLFYLPQEMPYERQSGKSALLALGRVFRTQKPYMAVMVLVFWWNMTALLPATALDVHLLQQVKVPYTLVTTLNASYSLFLLALAPVWRKAVQKWGWMTNFAVSALLYAPACAMMGLITADRVWMYPLARICQLAAFVGVAITYANMPYIALPQKDQTACLSMFLLITNLGALAGQTAGTGLVSMLQTPRLLLFGKKYGIVLLCGLQAICLLLLAGYAMFLKYFLQHRSEPIRSTALTT